MNFIDFAGKKSILIDYISIKSNKIAYFLRFNQKTAPLINFSWLLFKKFILIRWFSSFFYVGSK